MSTFLRSLLAFVTLGMIPLGCSKNAPDNAAPPAATDVTLLVPAMS